MKCIVIYLLAFIGSTVSVFAASSNTAEPTLCPDGAEGISCLGSSIAKNLVSQILGASDNDESPRALLDGIELVHVASDDNSSFDEATEEKGRDISTSLLNNLRKIVSSYEVRVRLSELMNGALADASEGRKGGLGGLGGGKVGKKGGGLLLMMMMMGAMMKMMAMGALAMLAMKALTVSSLAFMLSLIVGLKKLFSKKDDDDGGHVVQVVGSGGHGGGGDYHRRAFLVDNTSAHQMAYRGQRRK